MDHGDDRSVRRFVHGTNVDGCELDWIREVSVRYTRKLLDEDGEPAAGEDPETSAEAFVDLLAHMLVERPGMSPVFGLGAEAYDGGGADVTYKLWYHGLVEFTGPSNLPRESAYECLHPEERIVDAPPWLRSTRDEREPLPQI